MITKTISLYEILTYDYRLTTNLRRGIVHAIAIKNRKLRVMLLNVG